MLPEAVYKSSLEELNYAHTHTLLDCYMMIGAGWFNNCHLPVGKAENLIASQAKNLDTLAALTWCRKPTLSLDSLWCVNAQMMKEAEV